MIGSLENVKFDRRCLGIFGLALVPPDVVWTTVSVEREVDVISASLLGRSIHQVKEDPVEFLHAVHGTAWLLAQLRLGVARV